MARTKSEHYFIPISRALAKRYGIRSGDPVPFVLIKRHFGQHDSFGIWRNIQPRRRYVPFVRDHADDF